MGSCKVVLRNSSSGFFRVLGRQPRNLQQPPEDDTHLSVIEGLKLKDWILNLAYNAIMPKCILFGHMDPWDRVRVYSLG